MPNVDFQFKRELLDALGEQEVRDEIKRIVKEAVEEMKAEKEAVDLSRRLGDES